MEKWSTILSKKLSYDDIDIPQQRGESMFKARKSADGVLVDCLGTQPLIPWEIFDLVQNLLQASVTKTVLRGDAMGSRLGDSELPIESVEGQIALFYNRKKGDTVFRRISPVANLLVWAGLCRHAPGVLVLGEPSGDVD